MNQLSIPPSTSMTLNTFSSEPDREDLSEEFATTAQQHQHQVLHPHQLRRHQQPSHQLQHLHSSHIHQPLQQPQQQFPDDLEYSQENNSSHLSPTSDYLQQIPSRTTFESNQNMTRYSNGSHRSTPQPRYSEEFIQEKDKEFLDSNQQGWIHGFNVPYSVITFDPLQEDTTKKKLVRNYDQNMFTPKLVLDRIDHSAFLDKDQDSSHATPTEEKLNKLSEDANVFYNQTYPGAFAGHLSIPRVTYNIPTGYKSTKQHFQQCSDVPKLIYSTHLNHDNLTYVFGGLYVCNATTFKHLGLPPDVDISRVSVKFPYELPPFVNAKILTNPFMQSYPNFFMLNAQRGSVTCMDTGQMEEFPENICAMTGTKVSKRHYFFYGGFSIIDKSVTYHPELNRWIIHKELTLNEDAYIIDTTTLRFTKIKLSGKETSFITLGRIGNGICANVYDGGEYMNSYGRAPSPPIFTATTVAPQAQTQVQAQAQAQTQTQQTITTERPSGPGTRTGTGTSSLGSDLNNRIHHSKSPQRDLNINFPTGSHTSINVKLNNLKNDDTGSYSSKHSSLHKIITSNSIESQSSSGDSGKLQPPHIPPVVLSSQHSHQSNKHQPPNVAKLRINPNLPPANSSGTPNTATASTPAAPSTTTSSNAPVLQTPSSSTTKMMGNVLAKSTRIFHRHRHTLSDGNSGVSPSSATSGEKNVSSTSNSNTPSNNDTGSMSNSRSRIKSPHPLKYSYSQRHKEHRSKSPNPGSRPSSRTVSPNLVNVKPVLPGQLTTPSTTSSTINTTSTTTSTTSTTSTTAIPLGSVANLIAGNASVASTPTPTTTTPSIKSENSSPTPVPILPSQSQGQQAPQVQFPFPNYIDGDTVKTRRINTSRPDDLEEIASILSEEDPNSSTIKKRREAKENSLFNQASSIASVVVFIYGGFIKDTITSEGIQQFRATSDLLKIELSTRGNDEKRGLGVFSFLPEALVSSVGIPKEGHFDICVEEGEWPEPRGYFASVLIDHQDSRNVDENCALEVVLQRPNSPTCALQPGIAGIHPPNSSSSFQLNESGTGIPDAGEISGTTAFTCGSTINDSEVSQAEQYLSNKALFVQGGCDESNKFFSDFWIFVFQTGKWEKLNTYVYDYFNIPVHADEDDNLDKYTLENQVETPELKEAELRSCHHSVMYYKNEERDYLFFIGGLRQDYLRNFDKVPYESDKFDVSRFARFPLCTDNSIFVRISVLNIQTQTWRFMKYYYDIRHTVTERYVEQINTIPGLMHSRLCTLGGMVSMSEKMIILGHGYAIFSPEKKKMLEEMKELYPFDEFLLGGHILITFPGL